MQIQETRHPFRAVATASVNALIWLGLGLGAVVVVCLPADMWAQLVFALLTVVIGLSLDRLGGPVPRLMMVGLSVLASSRYVYWRISHTLGFDNIADMIFGFGLFAAELYYFVALVLGHFQTLWPLRRKPVPLPADQEQWPTVDVFVPTYNESLELVKRTLLAAQALVWPSHKLQIYLLDDGRRPEFEQMCADVGVHYMIRDNNRHAKAGNINAALAKTHGEYIAIFDCDHLATRSFLTTTVGWFLKDRKLALMQTPHYYFSPDPMERNLGKFGKIPNEGELFYGLLQAGNDLWDAAFFCGSCAVLRRSSLEEVGGVATETVTEDAHTALKLHRRGYHSAYIAVPEAAGLATESLSGHVGQRIRWARGMIQIFRTDNPMLGRGLTLPQRLCYLNAMLHFLYGLPRLVFLTAPLANLLFGLHIIHAEALLLLAYAAPHVVMAYLANRRSQGRFRHLLWSEVYEAVLAWYILPPTLLALINPRLGTFNVTSKGGLVEKGYFDSQIARPYLFLLTLNLLGIVVAFWKLHLTSDVGSHHTIWINILWTTYNIVIVGAAIAAARESLQTRQSHRVEVSDMTVELRLGSGSPRQVRVVNFSGHGMAVRAPGMAMQPGEIIEIGLSDGSGLRFLPARVVNAVADEKYGVRFDQLSTEQQGWLVRCTFARDQLWSERLGAHQRERPLHSIGAVVWASLQGLAYLLARIGFGKQRTAVKEGS
ncbi:UDP-forming cellulose synthase catalytic subunit [Frateuria aurantia]